jgi:hypothetical protein
MVGDEVHPEARHRALLPSAVGTRQVPVGADARDLLAVDLQPPASGYSEYMTASLAMVPLSAKTAVSHPQRPRAGRPKRFVAGSRHR